MKKFGYLVVFTLLCVMLTLSVNATLKIAGVEVTDGNTSGTGWSYDAASNTLTLNGADIQNDNGYGIEADTDLTIVLTGENSISAKEHAIATKGFLTISGDGTLTLSSNDGDGIHGGKLTDENTPENKTGGITINKANIVVEKAGKSGLYGYSHVILKNSNITIGSETDGNTDIGHGGIYTDGYIDIDSCKVDIGEVQHNGLRGWNHLNGTEEFGIRIANSTLAIYRTKYNTYDPIFQADSNGDLVIKDSIIDIGISARNGIFSEGDAYITNSPITIFSAYDGIKAYGVLNISGKDSKISIGTAFSTGIVGSGGINIFDNATVTIDLAVEFGFYHEGIFTIQDSTIDIESTHKHSFASSDENDAKPELIIRSSSVTIRDTLEDGISIPGEVTIDDSKIDIEQVGITAIYGKKYIKILNNSNVTIGNTEAQTIEGTAIYSDGYLTIDSSTVNIGQVGKDGLRGWTNAETQCGISIKDSIVTIANAGEESKEITDSLIFDTTNPGDENNVNDYYFAIAQKDCLSDNRGNLAITNSTVTITNCHTHAIFSNNNILVENSDIIIEKAAANGFYATGTLSVNGKKTDGIKIGTVAKNGIFTSGSTTISSSNLTIENVGIKGLHIQKDLTIEKGSVVNIGVGDSFKIGNDALYSDGSVTISGENTKVTLDNVGVSGICGFKGITVSDEAKVIIIETTGSHGFYAQAPITVSNATVTMYKTAKNGFYTDYTDTGDATITLDNAKVKIVEAGEDGIGTKSEIIIQNNSTCTIQNTTFSGIYALNSVTLDNATVEIGSDDDTQIKNSGIFTSGTVEIRNGSTLDIGMVAHQGIYSGTTTTISGSTVTMDKIARDAVRSSKMLTIQDSTLTIAQAGTKVKDDDVRHCITALDGGILIDNSKVKVTASTPEVKDINAIRAAGKGSVTINKSTVTIGTVSSSGIYANANLFITDSYVDVDFSQNAPFDPQPTLNTAYIVNKTDHSIDIDPGTPASYTVKLETNGGTIADGKNITSYAIDYQLPIALPTVRDITKDGYTFVGWYTDADFSGNPVTEISKDSRENLVFWAKWLSTDNKLDEGDITIAGIVSKFGSESNTFTITLPYGTAIPTDANEINITKPENATVALTIDDNGSTWNITVTAEDGSKQTYTLTITNEPDPTIPNQSAISTAAQNIQSHTWSTSQTVANTETEIIDWMEEQLTGIDLNGAAYAIDITQFTPAAKGKFGNATGTNGSFTVTITLSIGNATGNIATSTYVEKDVTISGTILAKPLAQAYNSWYNSLAMLFAQQYPITATAGEGGTITDEGITNVFYDRNHTYEITPADGYEVASVWVDGEDMGSLTTYTFKRVKEPHTITVVFQPIPVVEEPENEPQA